MVKTLCHLLMKVNYVIVANFYVANMSFNAILENTIIAKISEYTVCPHEENVDLWLATERITITLISLGA